MRRGRLHRVAMLMMAGLLLAALATTLTPTRASAFDGGSGGGNAGGGGGGGLPSSWHWVYSDTLNGLYAAPGIGAHGGAQNYVTKSSGGAALWNDYCLSPNLVRVYWIQNSRYAVSMLSGGLALPWSYPAGGDQIDQFASSMNYPGTYVICVVDAVERITKTETETRNRSGAETLEAEVAWNTSVAREITIDGIDPIGADNLNGQVASKTTSFGRLVEEIAKSGSGDYSAKKTQLLAAIEADKLEDHALVTLNDRNQAGLAEGGVLSVNEHTHWREVVLSQNWTESRSRSYTCDYKPRTNGTQLANPSNCSYGAWSAWTEDSGSRRHDITLETATPELTAFWQIVSVHCNPEELSKALGDYGVEGVDYTVISQNRVSDGVTIVLQTAAVNQRPTGPNAKLFGTRFAATEALNRTGELGFYDKHCSAQCSADPDGTGASAANGALSNVGLNSNRSDGNNRGGAALGDSEANYFEVFRDNDSERIEVNTAYPVVEGTSLSYKGSAPIATTVTLWNGSTPSTRANSGGLFSASAVNANGSKKLFGGSQDPTTQTNFTLADSNHPVQTFSGPYATKLAGAYRTFDVAATWASDSGAPVVMNVKWEYQPTTVVTLPGTVGFTASGSSTATNTSATQKIDVDCYAVFGSWSSAPQEYVASRDTGTGSPNLVDQDILDAPMSDGSNAAATEENLVIRFVRGVAE